MAQPVVNAENPTPEVEWMNWRKVSISIVICVETLVLALLPVLKF